MKNMMEDEGYPALYLAANTASIEAQSTLIFLTKWTNYSLVAGAFLALFSGENRATAIASTLVFSISLGLVLYGNYKNFQSTWYKARALAESIKTATWRLMMGAEPFSGNGEEEVEKFRQLLNELLSDNKGLGIYLGNEWSNKDQITDFMLRARAFDLEKKKNLYLQSRIVEQKNWYAGKSGTNRKESSKWVMIVSFFYLAAIACLLIRIAQPSFNFLPTDAFAVAASTGLAWIQMRRFDELSSAYGLTTHEIGIIQSRFGSVSNAEHLAKFVSDAENAFSREHTQWAARRDH